MPRARVSVLVTTYNHAPYVEEALDSLRHQTCQDFEAIITDDASTDGTPDRIAGWLARTNVPYQFIQNPVNRGICANRNSSLARSTAPLVCSLSGDDAYTPDRLAVQVAAFGAQPKDVAAVFGDMMVVRADGTETGITYLNSKFGGDPPPEDAGVFASLLSNNWMPTPAVMVRRDAFDVVGSYDETLINEDYDMWLRLSRSFRFRYLPRVIHRYRILPDSLSHASTNEHAIVRSRGRVLSKWLGQCGADERIVIDRLWGIGRDQVRWREDDEGARNLSLAAAADGRTKRRLVARIARTPVGRAALRATRVL